MLGSKFTSCWDKIGRADEHINFLKRKLKGWRDSSPYVPIKKHDISGSRHCVVVNVKHKPPVERWSLIAGDAVHNLRAALDHVLYAVVCHKRTQPLTPKEERSIQFPIVSDPANYPAAKSRWLDLVTDQKMLMALESVQPYKRPHADVPPLLGLLRDFDDSDKHRLLNVVMSNVSEGKFQIRHSPNSRITANGSHTGSVEDGTEIAWFTVDPPDPSLQYYHEAAIVVSIIHEAGRNGRNYTEIAAMLDWLRNEVVFVINEIGGAIL